MKKPEPVNIPGLDEKGNSLGVLHPAVAHNIMFGDLFRFSYFCHIEDGMCTNSKGAFGSDSSLVPPDIYPSVIWALQRYICALLEAPEVQLRACGHILPHQKGYTMKHALHAMVRLVFSPSRLQPSPRPLGLSQPT